MKKLYIIPLFVFASLTTMESSKSPCKYQLFFNGNSEISYPEKFKTYTEFVNELQIVNHQALTHLQNIIITHFQKNLPSVQGRYTYSLLMQVVARYNPSLTFLNWKGHGELSLPWHLGNYQEFNKELKEFGPTIATHLQNTFIKHHTTVPYANEEYNLLLTMDVAEQKLS